MASHRNHIFIHYFSYSHRSQIRITTTFKSQSHLKRTAALGSFILFQNLKVITIYDINQVFLIRVTSFGDRFYRFNLNPVSELIRILIYPDLNQQRFEIERTETNKNNNFCQNRIFSVSGQEIESSNPMTSSKSHYKEKIARRRSEIFTFLFLFLQKLGFLLKNI